MQVGKSYPPESPSDISPHKSDKYSTDVSCIETLNNSGGKSDIDWLPLWNLSAPYFFYKNLTLTLTMQENWLEYCALKFQSGNQFMHDLPQELLRVKLR